jgi:hypothetical protein
MAKKTAREAESQAKSSVTRKRAGKRAGKAVTFDTVREILNALPGVEEGTSYGTPGFRAHGKFLVRLWEDGDTLVVTKVEDIERQVLMASDPETFFLTDHYLGYPTVLIRLSRVRREELQAILERSWRRLAPKRVLANYDARS